MANYSLPPEREDRYETWRERYYFIGSWFTDHYYDPDQEKADEIERHYRWLPGDVIDPLEELQIAFGRSVDRHLLQEVADSLVSQSSNWRARPDEIDPELLGTPAAIGDPVGTRLRILPGDIRRDILDRIAELERAIAILPPESPTFGHNNPPESLEDRPATKADIEALSETLNDIRNQVQASRPDARILEAHRNDLTKWAGKVAAWLGARATKFTDEVMATAGKVVAPIGILAVAGLVPKIEGLAAAIDTAIHHLLK